MRNLRFLLLSVLAVPFALGGCSHVRPTGMSGDVIKESSVDYAELTMERRVASRTDVYRVANNVWNKKATSGPYEESVFVERIGGEPVIGWKWKWESSSNVVSYPEVIYGDKPWDKPLSLTPDLPFRVGSKRITVDYDISLKASGVYDMAFEVWPVSAVPGTPQNITHEIMIWIANNGMTPAGGFSGSFEIDGNTFDLYETAGHGDASGQASNSWTYVAFVAEKPILKGPLRLTDFTDKLVSLGVLTKDLYITSVELGNEVVEGTGLAEIQNYSVTIE